MEDCDVRLKLLVEVRVVRVEEPSTFLGQLLLISSCATEDDGGGVVLLLWGPNLMLVVRFCFVFILEMRLLFLFVWVGMFRIVIIL